jgi:hypothetical protein
MRKPFVAAVLGFIVALAVSFVIRTQTVRSAPDLSGMWSSVGNNTVDPSDPDGSSAADLTKYPMTPWGLERFNANRPAHGEAQYATYAEGQTEGSNDPVNKCVPPGVPRIYLLPNPVKIVQTADQVVMLFEYNSMFRLIYLDGRERPQDEYQRYMGWSNGHWEGDTLVVDTEGFNAKAWLDRVGHPYSEELQLRERFRRVAPDTLQVDMTFHDPKAYTRDWTGQISFKLHDEWTLGEYFCEDQYLFNEFQEKAGFGSFLPEP